MGKPHPVELRERAVRLVEQGHTHTETARRLCVSIKFVNDMGGFRPFAAFALGHFRLA